MVTTVDEQYHHNKCNTHFTPKCLIIVISFTTLFNSFDLHFGEKFRKITIGLNYNNIHLDIDNTRTHLGFGHRFK